MKFNLRNLEKHFHTFYEDYLSSFVSLIGFSHHNSPFSCRLDYVSCVVKNSRVFRKAFLKAAQKVLKQSELEAVS